MSMTVLNNGYAHLNDASLYTSALIKANKAYLP